MITKSSCVYVYVLAILILLAVTAGCASHGDSAQNDGRGAADDVGDDLGDDGGDDAGDDAATAPTWPNNHSDEWNCYICHEGDIDGSPSEPHDHNFAAPTDCKVCHHEGNWVNQPSGLDAPHAPDADCLNCHSGKHGKVWQENKQCLVCHAATGEGSAPTFPSNHSGGWDCYICHAADFHGSPQEPHQHTYNAPAECVGCHQEGDWLNDPPGPTASEGHDPSADCLTCHASQHDADWQDKSQCLVCHDVTGGGAVPTYPDNHKATWDCYTCHSADFHGSPGEPHNHFYDSPSQCVTCHQEGSWTNTPPGPTAMEGHSRSMDCMTCHGSQHGVTWQDNDECTVCHAVSGTGAPPTYPDNHTGTWDCYLCHAENFNGSPQEPHAHAYTAPDQCNGCHQEGAWTNSPSGPAAPGNHDPSSNCMDCHGNKHDKTWQDKNQCLVCHVLGDTAPTFPDNHGTTWDCYICHATEFHGSPQEPHGHGYTAPTQCLGCHSAGTWTNPPQGPAATDGHSPAMDCLTCHAGEHGATWQVKAQCLVCHAVTSGDSAPNRPSDHPGNWDCYICHATAFQGSPQEPHSHAYESPADCTLCHQLGSTPSTPPGGNAPDGHVQSMDCLSCHAGQHGTNWPDKNMCLICHHVTGNTTAPSTPAGHANTWNCYLCHATSFNGSPQEPHSHAYTAPAQCNQCHPSGTWTYAMPGPQAPGDHNPSMNCLTCHSGMHGTTWQENAQCRACHNVGQGNTPPPYPSNHSATWDCYTCHAANWLGATQEPHGHAYTSPTQCVGCHPAGSTPNTPPGPAAFDGHNSGSDCRSCHGQQMHSKTWQANAECQVCHAVGTAGAPPTWPNNHANTWDCYLCHAATFYDSVQEPHGHVYAAPSNCVVCHAAGTWTNAHSGAAAPSGHATTMTCSTCHPSQHGKTWQNTQQCSVCHTVSGTATPPHTSSNHDNSWNCYLCHQAAFNGAPRELHSQYYTAPSECILCHTKGTVFYTAPNEGMNPGTDCLTCHNPQHGKTWQNASQCVYCHVGGSSGTAPQFSANHNKTWNCYLCHQSAFNGAPGEPHSHAYTAPTQCLTCHTQGSFTYQAPNEGHNGTQNCISCHGNMHNKTWQDKSQCLYCHRTSGVGG